MHQLDSLHPIIEKIINNIEKIMVGKRKETILALTALLAEGHVLLEDVPGVGKTMLVRALSKSIDADYKRIQFTPDLLPSDVTGVSIYNPKELQFEFKPDQSWEILYLLMKLIVHLPKHNLPYLKVWKKAILQ